MKEQKIVIEIDPEGGLRADAEGFSGDACLKDLERLLEGLAPSWESVERKAEAEDRRVSRPSRRTVSTEKKR